MPMKILWNRKHTTLTDYGSRGRMWWNDAFENGIAEVAGRGIKAIGAWIGVSPYSTSLKSKTLWRRGICIILSNVAI